LSRDNKFYKSFVTTFLSVVYDSHIYIFCLITHFKKYFWNSEC